MAAHAIVLVFMPPEPLPWDRKEFFRDKKHGRSESLGSVTRWRDSSHHGSHELNRWGSADLRRPPGMSFDWHWDFVSVLGLKFTFCWLLFAMDWVINLFIIILTCVQRT